MVSIKLQRFPISRRTAPSKLRDAVRSPAAKKIASPGLAPTCEAIPEASSSDKFLATGPPSVPSGATKI